MKGHNLRIIFIGTPDFAVCSLKAIIEAGFNVVAVVTAPDKPAGRGYQLQMSAVKKYAQEEHLPVLQPGNLKSPQFIEELRSYVADLQIVIAFRMLPEAVWDMPRLGTFNLHASYLPKYRGAAPINRVIMNGETETGVTTFFLKHEIDTGSIIMQEKVAILPEDNAGTLHDKLMIQGANLVVKSLELLETGNYQLSPQQPGNYPHAPKIFSEDCLINPFRSALGIHNQVRGLSPYPAAFMMFRDKKLKIFSTRLTEIDSTGEGEIEVSGKNLYLHAADRLLELLEVQPEGKKRMPAADFINGLKITS